MRRKGNCSTDQDDSDVEDSPIGYLDTSNEQFPEHVMNHAPSTEYGMMMVYQDGSQIAANSEFSMNAATRNQSLFGYGDEQTAYRCGQQSLGYAGIPGTLGKTSSFLDLEFPQPNNNNSIPTEHLLQPVNAEYLRNSPFQFNPAIQSIIPSSVRYCCRIRLVMVLR